MSSPSTTELATCHVCGRQELQLLPQFTRLPRVTSDCKSWPAGGKLGVCQHCGCVAKPCDTVFLHEIEQIYRDYSIYDQSQGAEQKVFALDGNAAEARSSRLLKAVSTFVELPAHGRMLDVGCGNGAMLRSFGAMYPGWVLVGSELNDKYRSLVERIPGVEAFITGALEAIPGSFDLITLLHALEHIEEPAAFLKTLCSKLTPRGRLLVQVPDYLENPFDLLIADHTTHFTKQTLTAILTRTGLFVHRTPENCIPKELTAVGDMVGAASLPSEVSNPREVWHSVETRLNWLVSLSDQVRSLKRSGPLGIFGTSIAATWLFSQLSDKVDFFVDEDPLRVGTQWQGRPVLKPAEIPKAALVVLALSPTVGRTIKARMDKAGAGESYWLPPPYAN